MKKAYFGNTVLSYLICALIIAGVYFLLMSVSKIFLRKKSFLNATLIKHLFPGMYLLTFYVAVQFLTFSNNWKNFIDKTIVVTAIFLVSRFTVHSISYLIHKRLSPESSTKTALMNFLPLIKTVVWLTSGLILLDNFGFDINTILAGLGIGGVAVALASQAVLKDLFNYFVIIMDRPFVVGNFIAIGDTTGTVDHIGIKSTRLTSLSGEKIVFSNTFLVESVLKNYSEMKRRRVVFHVSVKYETSIEKLKEMPRIIEKAISETKGAVYDKAHFSSFADSSLVFEAVYFVEGNDYLEYMNIQQNINSKLLEVMTSSGIDFAYPTNTVHIEKNGREV